MADISTFAPWFGPGLGAVFLILSIRAGKRRRLVDDTPTCKTTGVFIGLVELKGTAESAQPLTSHLAEHSCVYYTWSVQEHWSRTVIETYTDSEGRTQTRTRHESGWTTVDSGGMDIPFYLQDDCGVVQVVPTGAEIEPVTIFDETCGPLDPLYYGKGPAWAVADSDFRRSFVEKAIPLHQWVYVMGQARERQDVVAAEITKDDSAPMFMISTRNEESISSGMATVFWGWGIGGLLLTAAGVYFLGQSSQAPEPTPVPAIIAAVIFVFFWLIGWAWMVFNSIVGLRQRVRQAWSQVDVQLKRRQDLIPNLVSTVKGLRDYESRLQKEVTELRSQMTATPPGEAGADYSGIAPMLVAIQENYPELKAQESFQNLQKNLIDTEQRIALARGYFNEIATFYNTRLEVVPDRFLAALVRMQPQVLLSATNFERQPVEVKFAD